MHINCGVIDHISPLLPQNIRRERFVKPNYIAVNYKNCRDDLCNYNRAEHNILRLCVFLKQFIFQVDLQNNVRSR